MTQRDLTTDRAPTPIPPLLYPISAVSDLLGGACRTLIYGEMRAGRLGFVRIGRRRFVSADQLDDYVAGLEAATPDAAQP